MEFSLLLIDILNATNSLFNCIKYILSYFGHDGGDGGGEVVARWI